MEALDVDFGSNEGYFEPDAFYESFQAPKFHDFTAPEEPIDPDAFFKRKPGMAKKEAVVAQEVKAMESPKTQKIAAQDATKTAPSSTPGSLLQAPPKTPVAAEKAVSAGSAKKVRATPLSSKTLKNGNSACNSVSSPLPSAVEKLSGSLKPTSLAKRLQASENDDPNSPTSNSSDVTPTKTGKHTTKTPAPFSQEKPLTRSRSLKIVELKPAPVDSDSSPLVESTGNSDKDGDLVKTTEKGEPLKKETPCKAPVAAGVGVVGTGKALKSKAVVATTSAVKEQTLTAAVSCKTPVKESSSNHSEVKKVVPCTEAPVGTPVGGHHCRSARCAANDPSYASPASVPTKKYLIARRGTPGSIKHATPNPVRAEAHNGDVSAAGADEATRPSGGADNLKGQTTVKHDTPERAVEPPVCKEESTCVRRIEEFLSTSEEKAPGADCGAMEQGASVSDVVAQAQVQKQAVLEEVFEKLALDQSTVVQEEQQETKQESSDFTTFEVSKTSKSDVEEFKEVLMEDNTSQQAQESIEQTESSSGGDAGKLSSCMVGTDGKDPTRSEGTSTIEAAGKETVAALMEDSATESKPEGVNLFLQVASRCLENFDVDKIEVPPSKHSRKRKSQEPVVGGSKRANCASDDTIKSNDLKVNEPAAPCNLKLRKRVTSPRPFRLRTQERGVLKEIEFNKKMEEYIAAKEGFNSAFQGLAVAEPKFSGKSLKLGARDQVAQPGHVFCAKRADLSEQVENDGDAKKAQKLMIPQAQKAPLFDHPFKPHRSTKKLTVPQEPKFHPTRGRRTCPSHPTVPAQGM